MTPSLSTWLIVACLAIVFNLVCTAFTGPDNRFSIRTDSTAVRLSEGRDAAHVLGRNWDHDMTPDRPLPDTTPPLYMTEITAPITRKRPIFEEDMIRERHHPMITSLRPILEEDIITEPNQPKRRKICEFFRHNKQVVDVAPSNSADDEIGRSDLVQLGDSISELVSSSLSIVLYD